METILHDIRYAVRVLARSRSFTFAALLTLTLGIGATTSIFSVLYGVVFQPLPYPDSARLLTIWQTDPHNGRISDTASLPDLRDWQAQSRSFQHISGFYSGNATITDPPREAERVGSALILWDLFATLGVRPAIGRAFTAADDVKNAAPVVIISDQLWRTRYGAQPILDRNVMVDGKPHRVVGVMPRDFDLPPAAAIWMPFVAESAEYAVMRGVHNITTIGRLQPRATLASAQAEMAGIMARMEKANPADDAGRGVRIESMRDAVVGSARPRLLMLAAAVSLVLLIGCINVAGLMLARSNARSREMAIRASLGASRTRLARQLFIESLVLSLGGAILGIAFTIVATKVLVAMLPALPRAESIGLHPPVLAFAVFVAVCSAIAFGLAPALRASKRGAFDSLRGRSLNPRRSLARSILVVVELALAMVLVVGAALFLASLKRLLSVDPGFNTEHVLTARIELPAATYPTPGLHVYPKWPRATNFFGELLPKLRSTPGVEKAALAMMHPFGGGWSTQISIEGVPEQPDDARDEVRIRIVSSQYFEALGIPLLRGRTFDERDRPGAPETIIINDAFVKRYFPHVDPIGKHIDIWKRSKEIVGVVRGERFRGLDQQVEPAMYPPLDQMPMSGLTIVLRTRGDAMAQAAAVRDAVHSIDRGIAVSSIEPVDAQIAQSIATPRFQTALVTLFGCIALILAAVGLYGLIAYQVQRRTREIGIRVALGAKQSEIAILVVKQGLTLALIGITIGAGAAFGVTRFIAAALFSVSATDPRVFALVAAMLTLVALAASYIPARRASRVDPSVALRYE
jgi:putative ABC transport system permease protein